MTADEAIKHKIIQSVMNFVIAKEIRPLMALAIKIDEENWFEIGEQLWCEKNLLPRNKKSPII